jgi:hypothetical protein
MPGMLLPKPTSTSVSILGFLTSRPLATYGCLADQVRTGFPLSEQLLTRTPPSCRFVQHITCPPERVG